MAASKAIHLGRPIFSIFSRVRDFIFEELQPEVQLPLILEAYFEFII